MMAVALVHEHPDYKDLTITNFDPKAKWEPPFRIEDEDNNVEYHLAWIHPDNLKAHVCFIEMKDKQNLYFRFLLKNTDLSSK